MTASLPLICIEAGTIEGAGLSTADLGWARANDFSGQAGKLLALPGEGGVRGYLFGVGEPGKASALIVGQAAAALPAGTYRLEGAYGDAETAAIAFRLGTYQFARYKKGSEKPALELPDGADAAAVERIVEAAAIARDLINIPSNDLGPDALEAWVEQFAASRGMDFSSTRGDALLENNFPMIHAVGRASSEAPRLLDLSWGDPAHPRLTLVGKGVTFDTGGLNIKPGNSMALMKKDMGGAANILGLAHAIVDAGLKVRLRVLIPVVENAIAGNAFRPGDILTSRKGLTVEIANTDAEGRLILADALALAEEDDPELIIDMATLTGSARIALGPDLPALFCRDKGMADELVALGEAIDDPMWQMPLWRGYEKMINSKVADINHIASNTFAGSVVAALFLERFLKPGTGWVHLDMFAWTPEARPGRPFGGTDQGIRTLFAWLTRRYG